MNAILILNSLVLLVCIANLYYAVKERKAIERKKKAEEKLAAIQREMCLIK